MRKPTVAALPLAIACFTATTAAAQFLPQPRIVNGVTSHDYPTTGQLLYSEGGPISDGNQSSWCSGTLIGCETFLTASHCVEDDLDPTHYRVFLQHAGVFDVVSVTQHPSYTDAGFPEFDVAVMKLSAPVTAIDPSELNTSASPPFATMGSIAGFGQTSGVAGDYGIKRAGLVETTDCTGLLGGLGNSELVCWDFSNPVGAPGADSNTCHGDSGGPLFVDLGGGEVVAGVTSGGTNAFCTATDHSYDANVFTYAAFVAGELGIDSTAPCGSVPAVGDPSVIVGGNSGLLGTTNTSDIITVNVLGTPSEIRFALNGENPGLDVDLYVKEGMGVSMIDFDCSNDSFSNFADCAFPFPTPGAWTVLLQRASGDGEYQLTTTIIDGDPPVCGNNVMEPSEECDGTDDASCPGACTVDCGCPCLEEDLLNPKIRSDAAVFKFKADLDNLSGEFTGIDPRNEFGFAVLQGLNVVGLDIPPLDAGWAPSKPEKGKYVWKGSIGGFNRVKIIDKTFAKGWIRVQVKGKAVAGAATIDVGSPLQVETFFDLACNLTTPLL